MAAMLDKHRVETRNKLLYCRISILHIEIRQQTYLRLRRTMVFVLRARGFDSR
jgi:hypothetical protein